jgi:predicted Ser/Thr protein kinase
MFIAIRCPSLNNAIDTLSIGPHNFTHISNVSVNSRCNIVSAIAESGQKVVIKQVFLDKELDLYLFNKETYYSQIVSNSKYSHISPKLLDSFICLSEASNDNEFHLPSSKTVCNIVNNSETLDKYYGILVMEFIDGITLNKYLCDASRIDTKKAYAGLLAINDALNDLGIAHADIHAANIIIDRSSRVWLIDYEYAGDFNKYKPMLGAGTFMTVKNRIQAYQNRKTSLVKIIFWFDQREYPRRYIKKIIEYINLSQIMSIVNGIYNISKLCESDELDFYKKLSRVALASTDRILCAF